MNVVNLNSKEDIIKFLMSFPGFKSEEQWPIDDEFRKLRSWFSSNLNGNEEWDYSLSEFPKNIPLFDVGINLLDLANEIDINSISRLLMTFICPWIVRIECLDRIKDGVMGSGDYVKDILVLKDVAYVWDAYNGVQN